MLIALAIADIAMIATFFLTYTHLPPQVPLLYSQVWGEQVLVDTWFVFLLPLLLNVFFFLNLYIYNRYFLPNELARQIFHILNWFLVIVTTIFFIRQLFFIS